ncbi:MAG: HAD family phosphatase [Deltaproteobacteria bacterium]|nr:HAD family phosphatase [Deltaproteobacteria bacterium]
MNQNGHKLVVVDVDGTLLNTRGMVDARTREAVQAARAEGVGVVVATGRTFGSIRGLLQELSLTLPAICCSGAMVRDARTAMILYHRTLSRAQATVALNGAARIGVEAALFCQERVLFEPSARRIRAFFERDGADWEQIADLRAFPDGEPTKVLLTGEERPLESFIREIGPGIEGGRVVWGYDRVLEVIADGVSKGEALERLALWLGIERQAIIAVGDSYNDLEMIEFAGLGVAMANAAEPLKAAADYVTSSNDEGGVAEVIERFILGQDGHLSRP